MRHLPQRLVVSMLIGSLLVASAASAGILKGHPYQGIHSSGHSSSVVLPCTTCTALPTFGVYTEPVICDSPLPVQWGGDPTSTVSTAVRRNCPPRTTASLSVWVDERATVWVNGQKTKPQRLAGAKRGSRIFTLTGLVPGEVQFTQVEVAMNAKAPIRWSVTIPVLAGQPQAVHVPLESIPVVELPVPPVIDSAVHRAAMELKMATDAANRAGMAAANARAALKAAQEEIDLRLRILNEANAAAQRARK